MSRLFWIEFGGAGRLAIMARPRADDRLDAEVDGWKTPGIDVVVSLLEWQEVEELGLQREAELCRSRGIDFDSFPIADRGVPAVDDAARMASVLAAGLRDGRSIAIHCRAGDRPLVDGRGVRADPLQDRRRRGACVDQGGARLERAGHRRAARLGDRLRQRRGPYGTATP
jgi:hypothetical protein